MWGEGERGAPVGHRLGTGLGLAGHVTSALRPLSTSLQLSYVNCFDGVAITFRRVADRSRFCRSRSIQSFLELFYLHSTIYAPPSPFSTPSPLSTRAMYVSPQSNHRRRSNYCFQLADSSLTILHILKLLDTAIVCTVKKEREKGIPQGFRKK